MGYYRPRSAVVRRCSHCTTEFEARHKRTIYCGESCRQLAYQARNRTAQAQAPASEGKTTLDFSLQNVGIAALGASLPTLVNHLLNDAPAQREVLDKLNSILALQGRLQSQVDLLTDIAHIQMQGDYALKMQVQQATGKRLAKAKQRLLAKSTPKS